MLTRYTVKNISEQSGVEVPEPSVFDFPEKVLQFGTGVLLRGLPDYFIDKANRQGIFKGRVVVVKSTDSGDSSAFDRQDGLYTICVRGIEDGAHVSSDIVNSSISRVISARSGWGEVLRCAHNPEMKIIISNTTEVGIALVKEDIKQSPPASFPGKLLAFLYERFKAFNGSAESGMVIIPTELIVNNGAKLESIVLELAHLNDLDATFMDWLENHNHFCSSLVDRIVPGSPSQEEKAKLESAIGMQDDLSIVAEAYRLWAIQSDAETVKKALSFSQVDQGVVIAPDITKFRELKLRLLNGTHTASCALAILAGFETVKESMDDADIVAFMEGLMKENIIPAILSDNITEQEAQVFASSVLDRFRNPFIQHKWISISMQYSSKMKMRNLPVLEAYYNRTQESPAYLALGFAAYLLFMKTTEAGGKYTGEFNGRSYQVTDDKAASLAAKWKDQSTDKLVSSVLKDATFWDQDLTAVPGFAEQVGFFVHSLISNGAKATIQALRTEKITANS